MESEISHFQYFINLYWPFVLGGFAVRVFCWFYGQLMYWISQSMGD